MLMMNVDAIQIIQVTISVAIVILVFIFLVYKPDLIIRWLKLDKGFDEDRIEFQNFSIDGILKLGLIIIGGLLTIYNIPNFLSQAFFVFELKIMHDNDVLTLGQQSYYRWGINFVNLLIGYLMLTNYPAISRFLLKNTQKKEE